MLHCIGSIHACSPALLLQFECEDTLNPRISNPQNTIFLGYGYLTIWYVLYVVHASWLSPIYAVGTLDKMAGTAGRGIIVDTVYMNMDEIG